MSRPRPESGTELGDPERADRDARRQILTELDRHFVVEAGAGTGKTAVLVGRFVARALGPAWDAERARRAGAGDSDTEIAGRVLSRQLAITFTEAAAREMQERIRGALEAIRDGRTSPGLPDTLDPHRARAALAAADDLRVTTLHSSARSLLARFPVEAGLPLRFEIDAGGAIRRRILRELVRESLRRAWPPEGEPDDAVTGPGPSGSQPWPTLLRRGVEPPRVLEALDLLLAEGADPDDLAPDLAAPARVDAATRRLAETAEEVRALLALALSGRGAGRSRALPDVERRLGRLVRRLRVRLETSPDADRLRQRASEALTAAQLDRMSGWARRRYGSEAEAALLERVADRLAPAARDAVRALRHCSRLDLEAFGAARELLSALLSRARKRLDREGVLSFGDLVPRARVLLERHPSLTRKVRAGLDQILVDELQDTDDDQVALLRAFALPPSGASARRPPSRRDVPEQTVPAPRQIPLALPFGDPPGGSASAGSDLDPPRASRDQASPIPADEPLHGAAPPGPVLFVVGDPKQSIYGWRSADLRAWEALVGAIRAAGGRHVFLSVNFRSVPGVLAEVARVVAPIMRQEPGLQPPFRPLVAFRGEGTTSSPVIEHWSIGDPATGSCDPGDAGDEPTAAAAVTSAELARWEAEAVARDLRRRHAAGVPWSRMAILLRSLTDAESVAQALREHAIPLEIARDRQYWRRREVQDALCLLRTVLFPEDPIAFVGWLRSPAVALPDPVLGPLWVRDLHEAQLDLDERDLPEGIVRLVDDVRALPLALDPDLAHWPELLLDRLRALGRWRRAFDTEPAESFVDRLRSESLSEATEAARWLGGHRLERSRRFWAEVETVLRETGRARRALAERFEELSDGRGPEPRPFHDAEAVRISSVHRAKGLEFDHVALLQTHRRSAAPSAPAAETERVDDLREARLLGFPSPGFDRVLERRERLESAERVRLLYVALTRARDTLVVSGRPAAREAADPRDAATFAELLAFRTTAPPERDGEVTRRTVDEARDAPGLEDRDVSEPPGAGPDVEPASGPASPTPALRRERTTLRVGSPPRLVSLSRPPADRAPESPEPPSAAAGGGDSAFAALGGALHRVLAEADLDRPVSEARAAAERHLGVLLAHEDARDDVLERGRGLLARFVGGRLWRRLVALHTDGRLVARAMPLWWNDPDAAASGDRCVAVGQIDLVYRDEGGDLVLGDWRTDSVGTLGERAEELASRADRWKRAASTVLRSPVVGVELWYVPADRVVPAPTSLPVPGAADVAAPSPEHGESP